MTVQLEATNICKSFLDRTVLRDVSLQVHSAQCLGVIGDNGSGKSTLVRILAGVLRQDAGNIGALVNGSTISTIDRPLHVGFVAPYVRLYDEFTPAELLHLHCRLRGDLPDNDHIMHVLERCGLASRSTDAISTLSSGLRQRVALALAIHASPPLLILDEPSITLDAAGRHILEDELQRHLHSGGIAIIATNDDREKELCTSFYAL